MRFPRHAKIFRGQLDVAPFAAVFFLLLIFVLLTSLVYTPGVAVSLPAEAELVATRKGKWMSGKETFGDEEVGRWLSERKAAGVRTIVLRAEAGAPAEKLVQVRELAKDLHLGVRGAGLAVQLPEAASAIGTTNFTVRVAVDLSGQFFYENALVNDAELGERLKKVVATAGGPVTLLALADRSVENEVMIRLSAVAQDAGVREILWATQRRVPAREPAGK